MTENDPKAVGRAARKTRPRSSFAELVTGRRPT